MGRSLKKGPYVEQSLLDKVQKMEKRGDKKPFKTWSRRSTVIPEFVGCTFLIHNGKKFIPVFISEDMVGHRLGEFASTRTFRKHSGPTGRSAAKT